MVLDLSWVVMLVGISQGFFFSDVTISWEVPEGAYSVTIELVDSETGKIPVNLYTNATSGSWDVGKLPPGEWHGRVYAYYEDESGRHVEESAILVIENDWLTQYVFSPFQIIGYITSAAALGVYTYIKSRPMKSL